MMAFTTHCFKKFQLQTSRSLRQLVQVTCFLVMAEAAYAGGNQIESLKFEKSPDGYVLTSHLNLEISPVVEDALLKGVAVFFVMEADIYRERWYWTDKKIISVQRLLRLSYQPLTKRWRLGVALNAADNTVPPVYLNQNFETLPDALSALQRISGWKLAQVADLEPDGKHRLEFKFKLDVTQLPRPLQLGLFGQGDWALNVGQTLRFAPDQLP
jgi:hypothetical protein